MQDKKANRIFVVGYMFSGKTTFARKLSNSLGYSFLDTDDLVENMFHYTIDDIFRQFGEKTFRLLETKVLNQIIDNNDIVIACGGGLPCYNNNMDLINSKGITVYLQMTPEQLFSRAHNPKRPRPLLDKIPMDKQLEYITNSLKQRESYYLQADLTIEGFGANIPNAVSKIQEFSYSLDK